MEKPSYTIIIKWKINEKIKKNQIKGTLDQLDYASCRDKARHFIGADEAEKGKAFYFSRTKDSEKCIEESQWGSVLAELQSKREINLNVCISLTHKITQAELRWEESSTMRQSVQQSNKPREIAINQPSQIAINLQTHPTMPNPPRNPLRSDSNLPFLQSQEYAMCSQQSMQTNTLINSNNPHQLDELRQHLSQKAPFDKELERCTAQWERGIKQQMGESDLTQRLITNQRKLKKQIGNQLFYSKIHFKEGLRCFFCRQVDFMGTVFACEYCTPEVCPSCERCTQKCKDAIFKNKCQRCLKCSCPWPILMCTICKQTVHQQDQHLRQKSHPVVMIDTKGQLEHHMMKLRMKNRDPPSNTLLAFEDISDEDEKPVPKRKRPVESSRYYKEGSDSSLFQVQGKQSEISYQSLPGHQQIEKPIPKKLQVQERQQEKVESEPEENSHGIQQQEQVEQGDLSVDQIKLKKAYLKRWYLWTDDKVQQYCVGRYRRMMHDEIRKEINEQNKKKKESDARNKDKR